MTMEQSAPLASRKRRRLEQTSGGWASLPTDIVGLITDRFLDSGNIMDYIVFRAVCSGWRTCTPTPRELDPTLRGDPRLRPRGWIALCRGDAVRPDDAGEVDLFQMCTGRRLRVRLPDLRDRRIIGFSDGLLVLLHKTTLVIRVLSPFTRVAVDFPSLASVYHETIKHKGNFFAMKAAVCNAASSSSSIAAVVWFPLPYGGVVVAAEAGSDHWEILHQRFSVSNTLVFQGRLYATTTMADSVQMVQLYPPTPTRPTLPVALARIPNIPGYLSRYHMFLAESGGQMLLVLRDHSRVYPEIEWWKQARFELYKVELNNNGGVEMTRVRSLLDRALILSNCGCLSVSTIDLPSLNSNSIYYSAHDHPILMHSLTTGLCEELAAECQIHDGKERIRTSVRPFTAIDHLLTFCHPKEWTKGLMFHEYHDIPMSFKDIWLKIWEQAWEMRIPPVANCSSVESQGKPQEQETTKKTVQFLATEPEHATASRVESNRMLVESNKTARRNKERVGRCIDGVE